MSTYTAKTQIRDDETVTVDAPNTDAALKLLRAELNAQHPDWMMARVFSPAGYNIGRLEHERFHRR